jgi:hypothetical protein
MTIYDDNILNDEVFHIIMSTCRSATLEGLNNPDRFRQRSRTIASNIYDMTAIPSGKISKGCIIAMRTGDQKIITKEHYHGRQEGGDRILRYVKRQRMRNEGIDPYAVKKLVDNHRQVHFTSADENNRLGTMDREDWQKMYRKCGIKLIKYVKHQKYDAYPV